MKTTHLLFAAAVLLGACDDPTVVENHPEVAGFVLREGNTELYRYMLDDGTAPGLTLTAGVHEVAFIPLDSEGDFIQRVPLEGTDEEVELTITSSNTSVLTWTHDPQMAGLFNYFSFNGDLNAIQAGTSTLGLCVPHDGHCDFEAAVPVTVTAQ